MMDNTWVWHECLEVAKNDEVKEILLNIHEKMRDVVQISILVDVPESNKQLNYKLQDGLFINKATQEAEDIKLIQD